MRRAAGTLAAVAIAIAGVIGLIAFFNARDDSTTGSRQPGPAAVNKEALLEAGNIELAYGDKAFRVPLEALAEEIGAPDTPALREAGAAVVLRREPGIAGIVARSFRETFKAPAPDDPRLQDFIERSLGQGAAG